MKKLIQTCFLASTVALAAGACGGDDDGDDDGTSADAAPQVDARPPVVINRSATIAIAQNTILNNLGVPFSGATVTAGWNDPADDVAPVEGFESNFPGCAITIYDLEGGDTFAPTRDEGVVTVNGTANGEFACGYSEVAEKYLCQMTDAAAQGSVAIGSTATVGVGPAAGTATYQFVGADFSNANYVGTYISVAGFPDDDANGTFPVLAHGTASQLVLGNNALAESSETVAAGQYASFVGSGPIPGGFQFLPVEDDALTAISITKPDSDLVEAIDLTGDDALTPAGFGFTLDDDSSDPTAFPTTAVAQTYTCAGAGGECGANGSGALDVLTISGEASDGDIAGLSPVAMGANPTKYATFSCSALGTTNGIEMSMEAVATVLSIDPTRVRIAVGHFSAERLTKNGGESLTNILSGHLATGFTTLVNL